MKRVLCIWFPEWPIQRLRAARPELKKVVGTLRVPSSNDGTRSVPTILHALVRGKLVVRACCASAAQRGVTPGMPLAEAKALVDPIVDPTLRVGQPHAERGAYYAAHEPIADHEALQKLALWAQRFSPLVAVHEPDCLLVDVTGCGPLFGGEWKLAEKALRELRRQGYVVRAAVADTIGAAWAVAHYGAGSPLTPDPSPPQGRRETLSSSSPRPQGEGSGVRGTLSPDAAVVLPGQHSDDLKLLPVESLRLDDDVIQLLRAFDIRRIDQLLELPRAALPSRFGPELLRRLDQALGDVAESLTFERAHEPDEATWEFEVPCGDRRLIEAVLEKLLEQVLEKLRPRQMGVQRLLCWLHLADQKVVGTLRVP
ncbi:MAG: DNA polymerase Y family protein, partial [Gemmataceae bacterium]|nr:DNA polymerase Y family protein [Gemmataceae bacterium]